MARGGWLMTWEECRETLTGVLAGVGMIKPSGWGPWDLLRRWLEAIWGRSHIKFSGLFALETFLFLHSCSTWYFAIDLLLFLVSFYVWTDSVTEWPPKREQISWRLMVIPIELNWCLSNWPHLFFVQVVSPWLSRNFFTTRLTRYGDPPNYFNRGPGLKTTIKLYSVFIDSCSWIDI